MSKSTLRKNSFNACLAMMWLGLIISVLIGGEQIVHNKAQAPDEQQADATPILSDETEFVADNRQLGPLPEGLQLLDDDLSLTWIDDSGEILTEPMLAALPQIAIGTGRSSLPSNGSIGSSGAGSASIAGCTGCGNSGSSFGRSSSGFGGGSGGSGGGGGGSSPDAAAPLAESAEIEPEIEVAALPPSSIFNPAPKFPPDSPKPPPAGDGSGVPAGEKPGGVVTNPPGGGVNPPGGGWGPPNDGGGGGGNPTIAEEDPEPYVEDPEDEDDTAGGGNGIPPRGTMGGGRPRGGGGGSGGGGSGSGDTGGGGSGGGDGGSGGTGDTGGGGGGDGDYDPTEDLPEVVFEEYVPVLEPYEDKDEEDPPTQNQEVPEPGALILFAMGLLGLGFFGTRRRSQT
ncbi:MAG: PEP-CTERM sorting domain-containing protein [Pseudomonadota bacterium]